jgi:hypothetical protein
MLGKGYSSRNSIERAINGIEMILSLANEERLRFLCSDTTVYFTCGIFM